jgi:hypothetical protein
MIVQVVTVINLLGNILDGVQCFRSHPPQRLLCHLIFQPFLGNFLGGFKAGERFTVLQDLVLLPGFDRERQSERLAQE